MGSKVAEVSAQRPVEHAKNALQNITTEMYPHSVVKSIKAVGCCRHRSQCEWPLRSDVHLIWGRSGLLAFCGAVWQPRRDPSWQRTKNGGRRSRQQAVVFSPGHRENQSAEAAAIITVCKPRRLAGGLFVSEFAPISLTKPFKKECFFLDSSILFERFCEADLCNSETK